MKRTVEIVVPFVRAWRLLILRLKAMGHLTVGQNFVVGPRPRIARGASLRFGARVNVGADFVCHSDVVTGDDIMVSSNVAFIGNDHDFSDPTKTIQQQGRLPRSRVRLEGDNLIGFGVIVLGNVTIGRGTIVGAGSLVTHDLPPESVCVGRPATVIRKRR